MPMSRATACRHFHNRYQCQRKEETCSNHTNSSEENSSLEGSDHEDALSLANFDNEHGFPDTEGADSPTINGSDQSDNELAITL